MVQFVYICDQFINQPDWKASMHRLRYNVFVKKLNWQTGIKINDGQEYDEYDNEQARYIIGLDEEQQVQAACRLIPTDNPYMLADKYPQAVTDRPLPRNPKIMEISRFCLSDSFKNATDKKAMGWLLAEAMKVGLCGGWTHFISLTTNHVVPAIRKYSAWEPIMLGPLTRTGEDESYALLFEITPQAWMNTVKKVHDCIDFFQSDL